MSQHERKGRSRVGHGVGAVEHYKPVIAVIVFLNGQGYLAPAFGPHVARVDGGKLDVVDMIVEHLDFWHIVHKMGEVKRLESLGLRVLDHADGAAGIDDKDARSHLGN